MSIIKEFKDGQNGYKYKVEVRNKELHDFEYIPYSDYSWEFEIKHLGLKASRVLKDNDKRQLENKIEAQFKKWDEQWAKISHKNKSQTDKEASLKIAEERTRDAQEKQKQIDDLLIYTLNIGNTVNWDSLKDTKKFKIPTPKNNLTTELSKIIPLAPPIFEELPKNPIDKYFALYISSEQKLKENEQKLKEFEEQERRVKNRFDTLEKDWEKEKETFYNNQKAYNNKIEKLKDSYLRKDAEAVMQYCEMVLNNSKYPDYFPQNFELEFNPDNKILILEYELPAVKCFPKIKEVNYISSKKELKESYISESQINKMFDEAMYKITLRTIHELFEADVANIIEAISFNGWVKAINRATGKEENNCILSIQVKKSEFMAIDLSNVDPKTCFKHLKGVASSKLSGLTPIQPILQISRVDKRFVEGYAVANQIDNTTNLAEMDWQDFEHLIRELFEKEFKAGGGEVKVTQASRDGGVDAIAFDPDPIRGGKIVIQAKRYTNTVGVSAVRELYGTVVNEGATKGILVSTADYGPDAYEFAKGKPLTLLNGSNLLHLLEKHGHHAKIDLREAKKILAEKDK